MRRVPLTAIWNAVATATWRGAAGLAFVCFPMVQLIAQPAPRERVLFTQDWRFIRHDPAAGREPPGYEALRPWLLATGAELIGAGTRDQPARPTDNPPNGGPYAQPEFDDSGWRRLDLPHDWGIEGPFDQALSGETGKLPWPGVGWYRKLFAIPAADAGRSVFLDIDGAMAYSAVWLNGHLVGGWPYGYTSYRLELTPYLNFGGDNVLAVRLDNPPNSSRWYPGSGIYRNVWLVKTGAVRVRHWGVFITTPRVSAGEALVNIDVEVENRSEANVALAVTTQVFELDANGQPGDAPIAQSGAVPLDLDPARARLAARSNQVTVPNPKLWSLESPQRYLAVTALTNADGVLLDRVETPFGIRTLEFTADRGFLLNGRRVPLRGVCLHHDLGALGSAINVRALMRQIELLQAMGCNAVRTSHNPPAPELLELCDRLGMVVMVEAFDCWRRGKKWSPETTEFDPAVRYFDYARVFDDWHERDLRAMIRRDRNHPSVVMWSIGNEIIEQWVPDGWQLAIALAGIVREEDRTRPVTAGLNNQESGFIGFERAVDLVGFNYKPWQYGAFHAQHPTIPVFGSETSSTVSTRGEYFFPVSADKALGRVDFQVSSYDLYAPRWAITPDGEWRGLDEHPSALGEFVWTGFDYLGEPTPYGGDPAEKLEFSDPAEQAQRQQELVERGRIDAPSRSSYFGIIDLAGFPKDRYFLYQSRWRPELPMAHILPHWNWPERVGQVTPVHVYSSGDEAELFLNGRSLGRKKRGPLEYRFVWESVTYAPGELRVVAYKGGAKWAEAVRKTTGPAAKLALAPDRAVVRADGTDLAFVTLSIVDADGLVVPRTRNHVRFSLRGPGEIVATDNGDATSHVSFQSRERAAFNGLALVIVRPRAGEPGTLVLRAESDGLESVEARIASR